MLRIFVVFVVVAAVVSDRISGCVAFHYLLLVMIS